MECTNCQNKKRCILHATKKIANRLTPGAACSRCKAQKKKCGHSYTRSDRRPNKNLSQDFQKDKFFSQSNGGEENMHTNLSNPSCLPPIFSQEIQISTRSLPQFMYYKSPNISSPTTVLNTNSSAKSSTMTSAFPVLQSSNRAPIFPELLLSNPECPEKQQKKSNKQNEVEQEMRTPPAFISAMNTSLAESQPETLKRDDRIQPPLSMDDAEIHNICPESSFLIQEHGKLDLCTKLGETGTLPLSSSINDPNFLEELQQTTSSHTLSANEPATNINLASELVTFLSSGINTSTNSPNSLSYSSDIYSSAPTIELNGLSVEDDYINFLINSQPLQHCSHWHQEGSLNASEFPPFSLEPTLSTGGDLYNILPYSEYGLNAPSTLPLTTASIPASTGDNLFYNSPSEYLGLRLSPCHLDSTLLPMSSVSDSMSLSSGSEEEKYISLRRKSKCDRCSAKKITCSGTIPCTRCLLDGTPCTASLSRKHLPGTCIGCTRRKIPCVGRGDVCYACQLFDTPYLCKPASRNSISISTSGDDNPPQIVPGKHGIEASLVDKSGGKRMVTHDWRDVCIVT